MSGPEGSLGVVFVERGRVCWAAARGLARRLTELLGARAGLSAAEMESLYLACKERRIPLGEHLVNRGVLAADDLRDVLLQHTGESLSHLWTADARGTWHPRGGAGYSPRFTFATAELLAHLGGVRHADVVARIRPVLARFFRDEDWGAAFVRGAFSAAPEPVALHGATPDAAVVLMRFGKWAASALDVAATFSGGSGLLSIARAGASAGSWLVAFAQEGAVVVGATGTHGPARILNRRAQERRKKGGAHADL